MVLVVLATDFHVVRIVREMAASEGNLVATIETPTVYFSVREAGVKIVTAI